MLVAENGKLFVDAGFHLAERRELHHKQHDDHDQRQGHPHVEQTESGRFRKIQVEPDGANDGGQPPQVAYLDESRQCAAVVG